MKRAALMPAMDDGFSIAYWMANFRTWADQVDELIVLTSGPSAETSPIEGPNVRVVPGQTYFGSVILRADVGGPMYFAIWDVTNNAEIENANRVSSSLERYMSLQRTFTVPTTCEEIEFRVYSHGYPSG